METFAILSVEFGEWIPARNFRRFFALIRASDVEPFVELTARFRQASDQAGTGAKNVPGTEVTGTAEGIYLLKFTVDMLDAIEVPGQQFVWISVSGDISGGTDVKLLGIYGEEPLLLPPTGIEGTPAPLIVQKTSKKKKSAPKKKSSTGTKTKTFKVASADDLL